MGLHHISLSTCLNDIIVYVFTIEYKPIIFKIFRPQSVENTKKLQHLDYNSNPMQTIRSDPLEYNHVVVIVDEDKKDFQ